MKHQKILLAGTFDNFHVGHQYLFWNAIQIAEHMTIIIARDANVLRFKKSLPKNHETKRFARVEQEFFHLPNNLKPKIKIRLGRADADFLKTIAEENPTAIILGYDQRFNHDLITNQNIKIIRSEPYLPELFKSSKFS